MAQEFPLPSLSSFLLLIFRHSEDSHAEAERPKASLSTPLLAPPRCAWQEDGERRARPPLRMSAGTWGKAGPLIFLKAARGGRCGPAASVGSPGAFERSCHARCSVRVPPCASVRGMPFDRLGERSHRQLFKGSFLTPGMLLRSREVKKLLGPCWA